MEVEGIIHSKEGGFQFPDDTVQETAAAKLTAPEVSEQRGKMTVWFSGITGVGANINFDVLDVSFSSTAPIGINNISDVSLTLNLEAQWPDFFKAFYDGLVFSHFTVRYFDPMNTHYMSHKFSTCKIESIDHTVQPFTSTSFGHLMTMTFSYTQIAITDEIGGDCKCYDVQMGLPTNCGCP